MRQLRPGQSTGQQGGWQGGTTGTSGLATQHYWAAGDCVKTAEQKTAVQFSDFRKTAQKLPIPV